jgi:hypothetical protein
LVRDLDAATKDKATLSFVNILVLFLASCSTSTLDDARIAMLINREVPSSTRVPMRGKMVRGEIFRSCINQQPLNSEFGSVWFPAEMLVLVHDSGLNKQRSKQ